MTEKAAAIGVVTDVHRGHGAGGARDGYDVGGVMDRVRSALRRFRAAAVDAVRCRGDLAEQDDASSWARSVVEVERRAASLAAGPAGGPLPVLRPTDERRRFYAGWRRDDLVPAAVAPAAEPSPAVHPPNERSVT